MDALQNTTPERPTLTFCVEGLPVRGELLFKAIMRLLDHATHQQWRYHPPSRHERVDLLVFVEGSLPMLCESPNQLPQYMLQLGALGENGCGKLSWPFKPSELEKELNRVGELAVAQRNAQAYAMQFGVQKVSAEPANATTATPVVFDATTALMRLQQWPPARVLSGPGRMRLATLLMGKAMSLGELAQRSALPLDLCEAFVRDLQPIGLLAISSFGSQTAQPQRAPAPKVVQLGLLARIRMRLGIQGYS